MNVEKYVQKSWGLALLFVDNENVGEWTEDYLAVNLTNFVTSLNYSSSCKKLLLRQGKDFNNKSNCWTKEYFVFQDEDLGIGIYIEHRKGRNYN